MPLHESRLTTSFRFGEEIADVANCLLGALNETVPLLGNPNVKSKVVNKPHTKMRDAILCRTNARAMELLLAGLVSGDKVALQADHQKLSRFVDAASLLKQGKRIIDVPELAWFNSWHDVHEYCETNDGSDIKPLVKLVDDHGTEPLKKALAKITPIEQADYVISTAHKAKGLEWNRVHIEDDYQFKINGLEHKITDEELRLLYVACTRAKVSLNIHHLFDLIQQLKLRRKAPTTLIQSVV